LLRVAIEGNTGNGALALCNVHGPASVLLGALAHQISDHAPAKGERRVVVGQCHRAEPLNLGTVVISDDEAVGGHVGTHDLCSIFTEGLIRTDFSRSPQFSRLFGAISILRFYVRRAGADRSPLAPTARIRLPYANTIQPLTLEQCVAITDENLFNIEQVDRKIA
jgi:hypothetical protein